MATALAAPKAVDPLKNVFTESFPQIGSSALAYAFTSIIDLARDGELQLTNPKEFPAKDLERFLTDSMDLTAYNNGNGVSFYEINELVKANEDVLGTVLADGDVHVLAGQAVKDIRQLIGIYDGEVTGGMFLSFHRSIQQDVACVYTIMKDTNTKKIVIAFRGSVEPLGLITGTNNDWRRNVQAGLADLNTPELIKHKMKGKLQERVKVRKGFYEYLFDNEVEIQRYDQIRKDIQALLKGETGYEICVTGHSLGGALASLFAFDLAGCGKDEEMLDGEFVPIPKPVTCITWAAPPAGTDGFRVAHEHLEKEGLLRCLRINNWDDSVPTLPPASLFGGRRFAHAGINIRLTDSASRVEHSSRAGVRTAIRNSVFKPVWRNVGSDGPHMLPLHRSRFLGEQEKFEGLKIDDLYEDDKVVSKDFIEDNF